MKKVLEKKSPSCYYKEYLYTLFAGIMQSHVSRNIDSSIKLNIFHFEHHLIVASQNCCIDKE